MTDPTSPERRRVLEAAGRLALAGGLFAAGGWVVLNRNRNLVHVRLERTLMETSVAVNALAGDEQHARHAIQQAFRYMEAAIATLTRFDPASPVARLNRDGHLTDPPPMLSDVLGRALAMSAESDGDFDATVAPVLDYYLSRSRPFSLTDLDRSVVRRREESVGYRHVCMEPGRIRFLKPRMAITLDGIAKGYVVDRGIAALREAGVEYALIDAGGEIRTLGGARPDRSWNVGIVDPQRSDRIAAVLELRNAALSTSGNYEVFFSADRSLFHIVNPHTGYSPDRYSSVTVMASECVDTDAASVAAFSMTLGKLEAFLGKRRHPWLVFSWDGSERWRSRDLPLVSGRAQVVA